MLGWGPRLGLGEAEPQEGDRKKTQRAKRAIAQKPQLVLAAFAALRGLNANSSSTFSG
jgi:hypothetical protein